MSEAHLAPERDIALDTSQRPALALQPDAPKWAHDALAQRPVMTRARVAGAELEVLTWGDGAGPGVLLAHGFGAHADWWRPIAPLLLPNAGRVVTFSFSGMGGSDWREAYTLELFAEELQTVAGAAGLFDGGAKPHVIAHSFGCLAALMSAEKLRDALARVTLIDFYLPVPGEVPIQGPPRKARFYPTLDDALSRFVLSPPQPIVNPFLVDFVARRTLRHVAQGWTWCSDPGARRIVPHDAFRPRVRDIACPLTLIRGARSNLMTPEIAAHIRALAPPRTPFVEIPDSDHHVLLDQPLALVAALRAMLAHDRSAHD